MSRLISTTERKGQKEEEETIEIKKCIVIDASPEVVFKAITDPNELTNWFPDHFGTRGRRKNEVQLL